MNENSYTNWDSMSDKALTEQIGKFVKHHRLEQNKTQDTLALAAGISRSTLSLLERGESVTIATLIQVLRVLDQLQVMNVFIVEKKISPILLAKMERKKKHRAKNKKTGESLKSEW
jgi:transcriptional regulator with XRE-family HTH domain